MEWTLRAPLHLGCAAVALARDDLAGAAAESEIAARLAAQAGEPTYTALAAAVRARVAHARRDPRARRPSPPLAPPPRGRSHGHGACRGDRRHARRGGAVRDPDPYAALRQALGAAPADVAAVLGLAAALEELPTAARRAESTLDADP